MKYIFKNENEYATQQQSSKSIKQVITFLHANMDWFSLTFNVLERNKQTLEKETDFLSEDNSEKSKGPVEEGEENGELSTLEAACLRVLLQTASLQLFIIDIGTCDPSPRRSNHLARQAIAEVLQETEQEITNSQTFKSLCGRTKSEVKTKLDSESIRESLVQNQARILELKSKLNGHEIKKTKEMNKKQEAIAFLKDKIHEEITKSSLKQGFVDLWETAKQNQHLIKCRLAESLLDQKFQQAKTKINNELRNHYEITTFLSLENQCLQEELEKWKKLYASEMKKREEKVKKLHKKKEEQGRYLKNLKQLYEEHKKEINEYLEVKAKIQAQLEKERFINEMAVKIQAWWRGTMVRRGLGSFKKKKKLPKVKKGRKN